MSVQPQDPAVFQALGDPTRLAMVTRLSSGPATVSALADDHPMSMPGLLKHLRVLEQAGLVERRKSGRVVTCSLRPDPLRQAEHWLADRTAYWGATLDRLGKLVERPQPSPKG
jgi:DNA-binding transcriptional ArsR family regulator